MSIGIYKPPYFGIWKPCTLCFMTWFGPRIAIMVFANLAVYYHEEIHSLKVKAPTSAIQQRTHIEDKRSPIVIRLGDQQARH
ncbi:hypothetical protein CEXT_515881 [Caerostris extrusa]|uniref:Uncharacterized protein n=1 Tax=Caerostris extrusa TaxID=172846 RepID=A0AAV4UUG5_CAEEX|nr:hypothetical protein CEXT_515881 [Caerostris extrusa]